MTKINKHITKLTLSAMFLAIGLCLPFLTGQIKEIGNMLLPMHLPVMLCGLICGWQYGAAVGAVLPLLRNLCFGMPPMPNAISMAFELMTYGLIIGLTYSLSRRRSLLSLYISLITAMLAGRAVWGAAQAAVMGIAGKSFTFKMFMAGAFINAVPGIILQLILVPAVMVILGKTGIIPLFSEKRT